MTSNDSIFPTNLTTESPRTNVTVNAESDESLVYWYMYLESILIGIICALGILGNLVATRNAIAMVQSAKQNSILALSLSISDLLICLIRGPSIIYVLLNLQANDGQIVCQMWMVSTTFVMISVMTNMIVAIERYMIVKSFHKYVKCFRPRHMIILFVSLWLALAGAFAAVYLGFGYYSTVLPAARSCVVRSNLEILTSLDSLIISITAVVVFGVSPMCVLTFCYVSIIHNICKAGLLKLDKIEEKVNYTKVTGISFARTFLPISCWTPFLVFVVIGQLYPEMFISNMHYVDFILIIYSAVCPFLTMHDNDFRESFSRSKPRYLSVFLTAKQRREVSPSRRRSNISSADMKTL